MTEELKMLEIYMKNDLSHLKRMAAGVRWIDAFMTKENGD